MLTQYQVLKKTKSKYYKYYILEKNNLKYFAKQQIIEDEIHLEMLKNEVEKYNILKQYKILPKIISSDLKKEKIIIYEYIEVEANNLSDLKNISNQYILEILIKICDSLEIMHSNSIVHCDLKPGNIIITNGEIKIIDLGNSRFIGEITNYGSLNYVSLEQLKRNKVSTYFDIYALGIIIYELFSKEFIFHNKTKNEIINLKRNCFIPQIYNIKNKSLNLGINVIIQKALTLNKKNRYKSIEELKKDLLLLLNLLKQY